MSLINKMLQDLDARRAAHGVGTNMPNDVRPLPQRQNSPWPTILGVVVLIVLAGGWAFYQRDARQEPAPLAPPVVPLALAPAAVPLPGIPAAATPENNVQLTTPPVEQGAAAPASHKLDGGLRMADSLKLEEEKKPAVKAAKAVAVSPSVSAASVKPAPAERKPAAGERKKPEAAGQPLQAPAAVEAQAVSKPAKPPMIERTDSVGTPRERSETEYRKAIAAVNQGRVEEALENLRNALRQDGLHIASRQLAVRLLLEAKRPDEAIQLLQDGLQGQPAQIGWAMSLARLQVDRGDLAGAWQTLNYSLPAAAGNADYQGFAAHVLQRLGRNKEAAERYQAAARLSPGDGRWWLGLGLVMDAEGRVTEAREAFLRARQSGNLSAELMAMIEQKLR